MGVWYTVLLNNSRSKMIKVYNKSGEQKIVKGSLPIGRPDVDFVLNEAAAQLWEINPSIQSFGAKINASQMSR